MTNEAYEQIKLFNWVAYARNTYKELDLLYHKLQTLYTLYCKKQRCCV